MNPIRGLNFRELWTFAAGVSGFALHSRTAHIESSQSDVGLVNLHGSPKLASSSSIEITATILHHRAPKRGGLNEQTWERITQETIDTEIALSKPGRYRLKAILFDKIESTPVEIQVTEPQTLDDREVWNFISNRRNTLCSGSPVRRFTFGSDWPRKTDD